jgi:hypothetical protein
MWDATTVYMLEQLDAYRASQGLDPVALDPVMQLSAENHTADMIARNVFEHGNPVDEASAAGWQWRAGQFGFFENIEWVGGHLPPKMMGDAAAQFTADLFLNGYISSPSHNANMLNPFHEVAGFATTANASYMGRTDAYVNTEEFAWNARDPIIFGAAFTDFNSNGRYDIGEAIANVPVTIENLATHNILHLTTDAAGYYGAEVGQGDFNVTFGYGTPVTVHITHGSGPGAEPSGNVLLNAVNPNLTRPPVGEPPLPPPHRG